MKPASFISTGLQWYEVNQPGKATSMLILEVATSTGGVCGVSPEGGQCEVRSTFCLIFFKGNFPTRLRKHNASQAGWILFPRSSILEGGPAGRSVLPRAASPWEWWQLEPAGESCCVLRCEGRHELCICYATVLPTAAGSFVVAVNALFSPFSPLKIREHSGLGCVRQSLPWMVGVENVVLMVLPTGVTGHMLGNLLKLVAKQPALLEAFPPLQGGGFWSLKVFLVQI